MINKKHLMIYLKKRDADLVKWLGQKIEKLEAQTGVDISVSSVIVNLLRRQMEAENHGKRKKH